MERDTKWIVGTILGLLCSVISIGGPAVYYLGSMASRFQAIERSQGKLQQTLERVMEYDLADVKQRITIVEQKDILPRAERQLSALEQRVRELETAK
ncbi:MAG: hypothetical protein ACYTGL_30920 [Planctomycetota bacterium]